MKSRTESPLVLFPSILEWYISSVKQSQHKMVEITEVTDRFDETENPAYGGGEGEIAQYFAKNFRKITLNHEINLVPVGILGREVNPEIWQCTVS